MARFLVVDDNKDFRESFCAVLEKGGHTADCVANGREALASLILKLPDAVLLDLQMPVMDGASFLEVVRSYLRLQTLPVVVLSAVDAGPMLDRIQELKVNTVLLKGKASPEDIQKALEDAVIHAPG